MPRDPWAGLVEAAEPYRPDETVVDLDELDIPVTDSELVALRKLITDTADAYAAREDHVVVLDDVVAEEIAQAIVQRYGIAT